MADLVAAHAAGITRINIKVLRVGGFTKARTLHDAAVALDLMVVIDDTLHAIDISLNGQHQPALADTPRMQPNGLVAPNNLPGNGFEDVDLKILGEPLLHIKD